MADIPLIILGVVGPPRRPKGFVEQNLWITMPTVEYSCNRGFVWENLFWKLIGQSNTQLTEDCLKKAMINNADSRLVMQVRVAMRARAQLGAQTSHWPVHWEPQMCQPIVAQHAPSL